MKKILFLFPIFFFLNACSIYYDGEERILIEGKILDENGNPMPNVNVSTHAEKDWTILSPSEDDLISYDVTDESGNFQMMFPSPRNEDEIRIYINYGDSHPTYSKTVFYNIQNENFVNQELDLGNISLYKVEESVELSISYQMDTEFQVLGWNLDGKVAENYYNLYPHYIDSETHFHLSFENLVGKNQNITIQYFYTNSLSNEVFSETDIIEIHDQPVHYEISF